MSISKKKAIHILEEIHEIAFNSTLTGALRNGGQSLVSTYNKIRELSVKNDWVENDLIEDLRIGTDHEMANIGVAAKLFAKILEDDEDGDDEKYDENGYEVKE